MCLGVRAPTLKEFPTDQAGVNVHVGKGDGADFFEVEIEVAAVDGVEIGAFLPGGDGVAAICAAGCRGGGGEGGEEGKGRGVGAWMEE